MVDSLKTFNEGEYIYASETNNNNQYLLSKLSDNAAQVQTYVEGEISSIQSNVASVQATLQFNIDELKNGVGSAKAYIVETYVSDVSWYRVWSDGWIEQGGTHSKTMKNNGSYTITLLKNFSNTNFTANVTCGGWYDSEYACQIGVTAKTTGTITYRIAGWSATQKNTYWRACGY